ncbi:MAG: HD domain-containing phosphohydrolase [Bryobacterales bacterium]|nr:HD domain-containing phosphohydrolase [Bryobacterales bacterium]
MAVKKMFSDHGVDAEFRRPVVLILEPNTARRQHLAGCLSPEPYNLLCATSVVDAITLLVQQHVDLLLLPDDLEDESVERLREEIRILRMLRDFPVITILDLSKVSDPHLSLDFPNEDFIEAPFSPLSVRSRVRRRLQSRRRQESQDQTEAVLVTLAQTVEHRDRYTGGHCQRLSLYSVLLGSSLSLMQEELVALYRGGFLHDIGKIAIPDSVLLKEGPLTAEERILMQSHAVKGEAICKPMISLARVLPIIRSHHERWDGSGYPDGIVGSKTPLLARILQVADIFDAITTKRPYKAAQSPAKAMKILEGLAANNELDPELVAAFLRIAGYPTLAGQSHQEQSLLSQSLRNLREVLMGSDANFRLLDLHQPRMSDRAAVSQS